MNHNIEPPATTALSPALPPWKATDKFQQRAMVEWVIAQLDDQDAEAGMRQYELDAARDYYAPLPEEEQQRLWFEVAVRRARSGNAGLLRGLYPEIAEFIQPPKRKQGRRRSYPRRDFGRYWASMIADDIRRVRELWQVNYDGKWKRRGLRPTAEEIVAERRGCTEDDVIAAMKLLSR
jgi:hypothetical protein